MPTCVRIWPSATPRRAGRRSSRSRPTAGPSRPSRRLARRPVPARSRPSPMRSTRAATRCSARCPRHLRRPAGLDPQDLDPLAIVTAWLDDWEASGGERRASATPQALLAAIDRAARARRDDLLDRGVGLLDRLAASALRDADSGLWFRAAPADEAGWEPVQTLDDQAAWIAVEAAASAHRPSTGRTARLTARASGASPGRLPFSGATGPHASSTGPPTTPHGAGSTSRATSTTGCSSMPRPAWRRR